MHDVRVGGRKAGGPHQSKDSKLFGTYCDRIGSDRIGYGVSQATIYTTNKILLEETPYGFHSSVSRKDLNGNNIKNNTKT